MTSWINEEMYLIKGFSRLFVEAGWGGIRFEGLIQVGLISI